MSRLLIWELHLKYHLSQVERQHLLPLRLMLIIQTRSCELHQALIYLRAAQGVQLPFPILTKRALGCMVCSNSKPVIETIRYFLHQAWCAIQQPHNSVLWTIILEQLEIVTRITNHFKRRLSSLISSHHQWSTMIYWVGSSSRSLLRSKKVSHQSQWTCSMSQHPIMLLRSWLISSLQFRPVLRKATPINQMRQAILTCSRVTCLEMQVHLSRRASQWAGYLSRVEERVLLTICGESQETEIFFNNKINAVS